MSKPRYDWWGYVKGMIRRYPDNVTEDERRAVDTAIKQTLATRNGKDRLKVVELVLMKQTHTIAGAAIKVYCSEKSARNYHWEFIKLVGKNFECKGLW